MATRKLSLATIRRTVSALPGVEEGTSYGTPAWRHEGKLLARLHQGGRSIVLKVGNKTRDHLLPAECGRSKELLLRAIETTHR